MTDAMQVLYGYAQDYIVRSLLDQEPEYREALRCAEKREEHFRAQLGEAGSLLTSVVALPLHLKASERVGKSKGYLNLASCRK